METKIREKQNAFVYGFLMSMLVAALVGLFVLSLSADVENVLRIPKRIVIVGTTLGFLVTVYIFGRNVQKFWAIRGNPFQGSKGKNIAIGAICMVVGAVLLFGPFVSAGTMTISGDSYRLLMLCGVPFLYAGLQLLVS